MRLRAQPWGTTLTNLPRRPRSRNSTFPVTRANSVSSLPRPTFAPGLMARPVFAGVNLAITYGLGLILGAVVLAMLYMFLSSLVLRRYQEEQQ